MEFSVSKLSSIEECDSMTEVINLLKQDLFVSESVDRREQGRISKRADQATLDLQKVKTQLASCEAQLEVVTDPATRNDLTQQKLNNEAKKFGLELRAGQDGNEALLLKEVDIATLVSNQEHLTTLLAAIASRKAELH